MSKPELANVEENWVYDTPFSKFKTRQLLAALPVNTEELVGKRTFLIVPHRGHEKAVRLICSRLFFRIKSQQARKLLETRKVKN